MLSRSFQAEKSEHGRPIKGLKVEIHPDKVQLMEAFRRPNEFWVDPSKIWTIEKLIGFAGYHHLCDFTFP